MISPHAYVAVTNDLNQDQRMHRICNTIRQSGYHVTLIGRNKKESQALYHQDFDQHRLQLFFEKGILFYVEYQIRLFVYLMFAKSPSLIFSVDLDTALPVRLAGLVKRTKTIHDAHELFTEVPELLKSPIKRWVWKMVGKITMHSFDHRITVNDSLAEILQKTYSCSFLSIRNLPNQKPVSTTSLQFERPYLWYQGVLNEGRGLEELIKLMKHLPDLDLRIAGEGDHSQYLRYLAEKSLAKDRIHFHGWMNGEEMHDWASQAWLGVNLLDKESGNYYHSLANRTFDFVQAELPTLHMDFPEYRSLVDKYGIGLLLSDLQVNQILSAIRKVKEDDRLYERLCKACKAVKKELVWELEGKKILMLLENRAPTNH